MFQVQSLKLKILMFSFVLERIVLIISRSGTWIQKCNLWNEITSSICAVAKWYRESMLSDYSHLVTSRSHCNKILGCIYGLSTSFLSLYMFFTLTIQAISECRRMILVDYSSIILVDSECVSEWSYKQVYLET